MRGSADRGFILITAVWMLALASSIVGLLMLHAMRGSVDAKENVEAVQSDFALEGAANSVMAELLLGSGRSRWAAVPSNGTVTIGSEAVDVALSNEAGRIDLNTVDPILLDGYLADLAVAPMTRAAFIAVIKQQRARAKITSWPELQKSLAPLRSPASRCLDDVFTLYSGLERPAVGQLPKGLATSAARSSETMGMQSGQSDILPGSAIRMMVSGAHGKKLMVIFRLTAISGQTPSVMHWETSSAC